MSQLYLKIKYIWMEYHHNLTKVPDMCHSMSVPVWCIDNMRQSNQNIYAAPNVVKGLKG